MSEAGARGGSQDTWKFILVGKSGTGKSATGNTLLGRKEFESKLGAKPVTQMCAAGSMRWNESATCVVVIDTPDIFGSEASDKETCEEIQRCITLSAPGPHALLLVTQLGRYTAEDKKIQKRVRRFFGDGAEKHMIVLFSRKEDLGGNSLHDYVTQMDNKNLKKLIEKCNKRYCAFDNRAEGAEQKQQVMELMEIAKRMVQENRDRYYTNKLYAMVEGDRKEMLKKIEKKLKEAKKPKRKWMPIKHKQ